MQVEAPIGHIRQTQCSNSGTTRNLKQRQKIILNQETIEFIIVNQLSCSCSVLKLDTLNVKKTKGINIRRLRKEKSHIDSLAFVDELAILSDNRQVDIQSIEKLHEIAAGSGLISLENGQFLNLDSTIIQLINVST